MGERIVDLAHLLRGVIVANVLTRPHCRPVVDFMVVGFGGNYVIPVAARQYRRRGLWCNGLVLYYRSRLPHAEGE